MSDQEGLAATLQQALESKAATRRWLASLPYEEKLRRMLQMQANIRAMQEARLMDGEQPGDVNDGK